MHISDECGRRIHIMGKPDETRGYMLKVYDAQTSEEILNIFRIELVLDARGINTAKIDYYEHDAQGNIVVRSDGSPFVRQITVDTPSLNLTAYELVEEENT